MSHKHEDLSSNHRTISILGVVASNVIPEIPVKDWRWKQCSLWKLLGQLALYSNKEQATPQEMWKARVQT